MPHILPFNVKGEFFCLFVLDFTGRQDSVYHPSGYVPHPHPHYKNEGILPFQISLDIFREELCGECLGSDVGVEVSEYEKGRA